MPGWALTVLAADPEQNEAGPTALLVVVLLGLGIVFLARSMIKHLRRVPASFDPPPQDSESRATGMGTPGIGTPGTGTPDPGTPAPEGPPTDTPRPERA